MPIFEKKVGGVHRGNWSLRKLVPDFDHNKETEKTSLGWVRKNGGEGVNSNLGGGSSGLV
jgi:hypothetical protein